jgi:hypothetical protein
MPALHGVWGGKLRCLWDALAEDAQAWARDAEHESREDATETDGLVDHMCREILHTSRQWLDEAEVDYATLKVRSDVLKNLWRDRVQHGEDYLLAVLEEDVVYASDQAMAAREERSHARCWWWEGREQDVLDAFEEANTDSEEKVSGNT